MRKKKNIWDKSSASTFNGHFEELCGIMGVEKLFGDFTNFHLHEQGEIIRGFSNNFVGFAI